jgi:hypothetical protein
MKVSQQSIPFDICFKFYIFTGKLMLLLKLKNMGLHIFWAIFGGHCSFFSLKHLVTLASVHALWNIDLSFVPSSANTDMTK